MLYKVAKEIEVAEIINVTCFENWNPLVKNEKTTPSMNARKGSKRKLILI